MSSHSHQGMQLGVPHLPEGELGPLSLWLASLPAPPIVELWFNEASGESVIVNHAASSVGNGDFSPGDEGGLGFPGFNGETAALYDGHMGSPSASTLTEIANVAAIQGLTEFTLFFFLRVDGPGESNLPYLVYKSSDMEIYCDGPTRIIRSRVFYTSVVANQRVTVGPPLDAFSTIFIKLNDTEKVSHILLNGVEGSYNQNTAGVGTRPGTANNMNLGNHAGQTGTFEGLWQYFVLWNYELSDDACAKGHEAITGVSAGQAALSLGVPQ